MYTIEERYEGPSAPVTFRVKDDLGQKVHMAVTLDECLIFLRTQGQLFAVIQAYGTDLEWTLTDIQQISAIERASG